MKQFIIYIALIVLVSACSGVSAPERTSNLMSLDENKIIVSTFENRILNYKGSAIYLGEQDQNKAFISQKITQQKKDILYSANKMSTRHYLMKKGLKEPELSIAMKELKGEQLFYIEFQEEQKRDLVKKYFTRDIDKSIAYISFDIQDDFILINGQNDTIKPDYSLYERNFHVAPFERILLSFSGVTPKDEIELIYQDQLFGRGKFHFHFPSTDYITKYTQIAL